MAKNTRFSSHRRVSHREKVVPVLEQLLLREWMYLKRRKCKTVSPTGLWTDESMKSGYVCVHAPGPADRGYHIQIELPLELIEFATKSSGKGGTLSATQKAQLRAQGLPTTDKKPKGVRWDNYTSLQDAARSFAQMMADPEYFIHMMLTNKPNSRWYE